MAKLLLIAAALPSEVVASETQKQDVSIECFMDIIESAKDAIPIVMDAVQLATTCEGDVKDCVGGVVNLIDHLSTLEVKITGTVGACDSNASPTCVKGIQGVGEDIHKILGPLNEIKSTCVLNPKKCLADIEAIIPSIKNVPETIQHAARSCAGHTSYDWCDCGKGQHWIDVWDPSNPSDRHRIPVGGWAPIKWQRPVSDIRWVCDGGMSTQRANLPANQAWRMSFTVESKRCGWGHKNSGRIEWDSAGMDIGGANESTIVV